MDYQNLTQAGVNAYRTMLYEEEKRYIMPETKRIKRPARQKAKTIHGINTIQGLITLVKKTSTWTEATIQNVIVSLGYDLEDNRPESLKEVSGNLADCAKYGADIGFTGFISYSDTIEFYFHNREDIIKNLGSLAEEIGEDILIMVQSFGIFRCSAPPTIDEVGKALWDTSKEDENVTELYYVFSWFCLEDISHIWYRYLEDNPNYYAELTR
jgi:hypothetical protein